MQVHGFNIDSVPSDVPHSVDDSGKVVSDGFATTVSDAHGSVRGPFKTVREAIQCAHAWKAENDVAAERKRRDQAEAETVATKSAANPATTATQETVEEPVNSAKPKSARAK